MYVSNSESNLFISWNSKGTYYDFMDIKEQEPEEEDGDLPEGYICAKDGKWDGTPCWAISDDKADTGCYYYVNYQDTPVVPLEGWEVLDAPGGGAPPTLAVVDTERFEKMRVANETFITENPCNEEEEFEGGEGEY